MFTKLRSTIVPVLILTIFLSVPSTSNASSIETSTLSTLLSQLQASLSSIQQALFKKPAVLGVESIVVRNSDELMTALTGATGGETIMLESGVYTLSLFTNKHTFALYPSTVTITSKDSNNRARFSQVGLAGVSNLTFDNVVFDYTFPAAGEAHYARPFNIRDAHGGVPSKNITIKNSLFDGDVARNTGDDARDGYGTAYALGVTKGEDIVVENNIFTNWMRAGVFGGVTGGVIKDNEIYDIRSDGFNFAGVTDVVIEGNHFHSFRKSPESSDHMDMIQFWTNGQTTPNTDIIIRNNLLLAGDGSWTQSIFMRNEEVDTGRAGTEMYYRNVTIENNVIHNAHAHGITLGEADGVRIRNNTLLHNKDAGDDGAVTVPRINMKPASKNVDISNNIIATYQVSNAGERDGNLFVQQGDVSMPHHYSDYFVNALAQGDATFDDLTVVPGSLADTKNYGSSLLQPTAATLHIQSESQGGLNMLTHSFGVGGAGVSSVTWKFGDGSTGTGTAVEHEYAKAGVYTVIATVKLTSGATKQIQRVVEVRSPLVLDVTFDSTTIKDSSYLGLVPVVNGSPTSANGYLTFTNDGTKQNVVFPRRPEFLNTREFTLAFDVKFNSEDQNAWLIYFSSSYVIKLTPTTSSFRFAGADARPNPNLSLNEWHRVVVVHNGYDRTARIYINGALVYEQAGVAEVQPGSTAHSFTIGDLWGAASARSVDNVLLLLGAMSPTQVTEYTANRTLPIGAGTDRSEEPEIVPEVVPVPEPTPTPTQEEDPELIIDPEPPTDVEESVPPEEEVVTPAPEEEPEEEVVTPTPDITTDTDRVRTTANLNVRATANGRVIGRVPQGTLGTQSDDIQSRQLSGYTWVYVEFDTGLEGYVAAEFLAPASAPVITSNNAAIMAQIQILLEMVQVLQARLNVLLGR